MTSGSAPGFGYRPGRRSIAAALALAAGLAAVRLAPRGPLVAEASFSQAVFDREGRLLRLTVASDERYRMRVPLERISPALVEATLLHEDRWFFVHPGVNPAALARAAWQTWIRGGRRVGGSTLTMQLARLTSRAGSRTAAGKVEQIARALWLEATRSKREILEAYLTVAPYGGNVEGVGAASLVWFGKTADRLSLPEALALAVIPQSPARRLGARPEANGPLFAAQLSLFDRWVERHPADADRRPRTPPALRRAADLPFLAPHFVDAAVRADPTAPEVKTTLDFSLQKTLERHVKGHVERRRADGIANASALLVDRRTMEIRAAVGSADFFDRAIRGQVNGTKARRSPGSALKPFIYALGIDQGLLHPLSLLKDTPSSFGGYNPENFDGQFAGPLRAIDALNRSRNVPAVAVASRLTEPTLFGFLRRAGVGGLRDEPTYGLSLVLGSAEVTMEELAAMYAMLGNGGLFRPVKNEAGAEKGEPTRLLSPEAAWSTLSMLAQNPRPREAQRSQWERDPLRAAWKTGTSHGYRDAWTAGLFGEYVLVVWVGNFEGQSNPAFVGTQAASPLFFAVADAVRASEPAMPDVMPQRPERLQSVEVCAVSGKLPGLHCRARARTWFIPGTSPIEPCDIHREVLVDAAGLRACRDGPGTRPEVYEFWPSDLLKLFASAGVPRRLPPPDGPGCSIAGASVRGVPPRITSPQAGVAYALRAAAVGQETVALQAVTDADARHVFWFVGETLVGATGSREPLFWTARPGNWVVRAVDDHGRSDARDIRVTVVQ